MVLLHHLTPKPNTSKNPTYAQVSVPYSRIPDHALLRIQVINEQPRPDDGPKARPVRHERRHPRLRIVRVRHGDLPRELCGPAEHGQQEEREVLVCEQADGGEAADAGEGVGGYEEEVGVQVCL